MERHDRTGERNINNFGSLMEIVKYKNTKDMLVKFIETSTTVTASYDNFIRGKVKNPYDKTVCGIGCIGKGLHKTSIEGKHTPQYKTWKNMIERCYNKNFHKSRAAYTDCFVCDEWLNFQVFADWYNNNFYQIDNEKMHLDKDILIKGNKVYSADTCIFVPLTINILYSSNTKIKGEYPIGVYWSNQNKKYIAQYNNITGERNNKAFDTPEEAFYTYKYHKEKYIKFIANKYKNRIPEKLYNAMYTYQVEITD
jgi:hypothetical protein